MVYLEDWPALIKGRVKNMMSDISNYETHYVLEVNP